MIINKHEMSIMFIIASNNQNEMKWNGIKQNVQCRKKRNSYSSRLIKLISDYRFPIIYKQNNIMFAKTHNVGWYKYKLFLYLVPLITRATLTIYHYDVIMIITTTTAIIGRLVVMKRISTEFFFTNKKSMNAKFRNETKNENQSQGKKANINTKWKWIPNSSTITMLYSPPLLPSSSWSWQ